VVALNCPKTGSGGAMVTSVINKSAKNLIIIFLIAYSYAELARRRSRQ
jgi:hypothetical protein